MTFTQKFDILSTSLEFSMKKLALILTFILLFGNALAIENNLPYKFDTYKMEFVQNNNVNLTKTEQNEYKYAQKYMQKAKSTPKTDKKVKYYKKILKKSPNYMPALYELMFLNAKISNTQEVYKYAKKLRELNNDNILPRDMLTDIIARSCFHMGKYNEAANEFEKITDLSIAKRNYIILAEAYVQLNDFNNVIKYASKITKSESDFYDATELLYIANYSLKNNQKAYGYSKQLINLKPDVAQNYLRAAQSCSDKKLKLQYLYKAKKLLLENPSLVLYTVDKKIAEIEQEKIDTAYKKITDFLIKPDWTKIYINNSPDITFYINNWSKRQDEFFKTANNCIAKYSGNNLVKCFEALNNSEDKKTDDLKDLLKKIEDEKKQKEQELMLQRLLLLQQQMNYNRYYYYHPYRYYRPYFYW